MADPGPPLDPAVVDAGYAEARRELGTFNLGLLGLTGVGKSTLVNAVFGAELARTGIGDPVTQHSRLYRHHASNLGLYDTKGLEIGAGSAALLHDLRRFVETNRLGALQDQIHVVWYAIRAGTRRIQPGEQELIRAVAGLGIPVLLVMTQTPLTANGSVHADAAALAESVTKLRLPVRGPVHFVNALGDEFAGVPPFGLPTLLEATAEVAPEGVRSALAAAQRVSRRQKRAQAGQEISRSEHRVRARIVLRGLGKEWARLFAAIAAIYDMPEIDSRAVLKQATTVTTLRRILRIANTAVAVGLFAPAAAVSVARKVKHRGGPQPEPEPDLDTAAESAKPRRIRSGLAAGRVTRSLGEAWLETCEQRWSQAFPDSPDYRDHELIAEQFATELADRLPRGVRRWHERSRT